MSPFSSNSVWHKKPKSGYFSNVLVCSRGIADVDARRGGKRRREAPKPPPRVIIERLLMPPVLSCSPHASASLITLSLVAIMPVVSYVGLEPPKRPF